MHHADELPPAAALLRRALALDAPSDPVVVINAGAHMAGLLPARSADSSMRSVDRSFADARHAAAAFQAARLDPSNAICEWCPPIDAGTIALRMPREKIGLLQSLYHAFTSLGLNGRLYVAGGNDEGAKTAARLMTELFGNADTIARDRAHRLIVSEKRTAAPVDDSSFDTPWLDRSLFHSFDVSAGRHAFALFTRPGVFSWQHLDEATHILADTMQIPHSARVLDLGCGAGALGTTAALSGAAHVTMVDADMEAVHCAAQTAAQAGTANVTTLASDAGSSVMDRRFDVVVTNPPFHSGKSTDLDTPYRFIADAHALLARGGTLYLVANRTLPYEREIERLFGNVATAHDGARFKVLTATR